MAAERQEAPESSKEVESGQIKTPRLRGDEFSQEATFAQEARRVAGELVRLHRHGGIRSQADASFYANLIHTFRGNYTKPIAAESDAPSPRPYEQYQSLSVRDRESEEDAVGSQEERK